MHYFNYLNQKLGVPATDLRDFMNIASRESLRPANCVGVIDSDYRGPFMVPLHNDGETARTVEPGERIAQLIIMPYLPVTFEATEEELSSTRRGESGFGSTGK